MENKVRKSIICLMIMLFVIVTSNLGYAQSYVTENVKAINNLIFKGDCTTAISSINKSLITAKKPDEKAILYVLLGFANFKLKNWKEAEKNCNAALKTTKNPELLRDANYLMNKISAGKMQKTDNFKLAINSAHTITEKTIVAMYYINERYFHDFKMAQEVFEYYNSNIKPNNDDAYHISMSFIATCTSNNKYKEALDACKVLDKSKNPNTKKLVYKIKKAHILYELGMYDAAMKTYDEVFKDKNSNNQSLAEVYFGRAQIYEKRGDVKNAKLFYNKAYTLAKSIGDRRIYEPAQAALGQSD